MNDPSLTSMPMRYEQTEYAAEGSQPISKEGWQQLLRLSCDHWELCRDGEREVRRFYERHYSARIYKDGRESLKCMGPGEYMLLMTPERDALFGWRKFRSMRIGEWGVNCSVFRNESGWLSSMLIGEAVQRAWARWPQERLYTYVNSERVDSPNPGYCFKMAGWKTCGQTAKGLLVLELLHPKASSFGVAHGT